jgi:hypothetical protein
VDFPRNVGVIAAREEMTMTRGPRRNHSPAFKAEVAVVVLSRLRSGLSIHLGSLSFEGQGAFAT